MTMAKYSVLHSGDKMPLVGLGTWLAPPNVVCDAVKVAVIECGYVHVDCARVYGNENEVGVALKAAFDAGIKRENLFITSKLWCTDRAPQDVRTACMATLKDLGLQYLDLYLIHWPLAFTKDMTFPPKPEHFLNIPIIDTWREMEKLVDDGLVRNIGVSNFTTRQLETLWRDARIKPAVDQVELHPLLQQTKLREYCKLRNIHVTAYSSLGNNDSPFRGNAPNLLQNATILKIAAKHKKSPAQVLLRWGLQLGVTVIPKSTKKERVLENAQLWDFTLDADDMCAIAAEETHLRTAGDFFLNGKTLAEFWDNE